MVFLTHDWGFFNLVPLSLFSDSLASLSLPCLTSHCGESGRRTSMRRKTARQWRARTKESMDMGMMEEMAV